MKKFAMFPKISFVKPLPGKCLHVTFSTGEKKIYDCSKLLKNKAFVDLKNDAFFNSVHTGQGGYGVVWNDEIDLSESELWLYGKPIKPNESFQRTGHGFRAGALQPFPRPTASVTRRPAAKFNSTRTDKPNNGSPTTFLRRAPQRG